MAETPGMRDAIAQQEKRLRDHGMPPDEAARRARQSGLSVDRKIAHGELPAPKR